MKTDTLSHATKEQWGWLAFVEAFAVLGTTFDDAGVLFPPVPQVRTSVKYYIAGVRKRGIM